MLAVITGKDLEAAGLHWMPTLAGDKQMVLPVDTVMYQSQEVAAVIALTRYQAADAITAVNVDYEPLQVVVDPFKALEPDAPVLRPDRGPDKANNHIWHWESGDRAATDAALDASDRIVPIDVYIPRIHVASIETCGCIADYDAGQRPPRLPRHEPGAPRLPHGHQPGLGASPSRRSGSRPTTSAAGSAARCRSTRATSSPSSPRSRSAGPSSGSRTGPRTSRPTRFARDYHVHAELGLKNDGTMTGLRVKTLADHGYADAAADPCKYPAGLFNVITGSYQMPQAFVEVDAAYTNKPPGGVAYRCSFRVTEAVHTIERLVDKAADVDRHGPGRVPDEELHPQGPVPVPQRRPAGSTTRATTTPALQKALDQIGYGDLLKEQAEKRARGELMGIGISSFTEIVGAGPSKDFDIIGIKMFDSAELRVHPTGSAILRLGVQSQGQGHETTFAQIVAEELGIPASKVKVEEGDTDTAPYGLGTYASRSTPVAGAATAMVVAQDQGEDPPPGGAPARGSPDDLEWTPGQWNVKGSPDRVKTIAELAFAAYTNHPAGMEAGLEAVDYYDPPNLTFPFGSYICVVDIDKGTGQVHVRRFVAVDDCGNIINPMIVDGQIHGGLTMGLAPSLYEEISYDEQGNNLAGTFMDYLLPTAVETPAWETGKTITPSPHHPLGAKGVGESATVGAPPAIANAVVDALSHLGVDHIDIPITPQKVWAILHEKGIA